MKIKNLVTASLLTATMITSSFSASTAIQTQNNSYTIPYNATLNGKLGYSVSTPTNGVDSSLVTISIDNMSVNNYKLKNCVIYANASGNLAYESIEIKPYKITCTDNSNQAISAKIAGIVTDTNNNSLHGMITKSQFSKYPIMSIKASTPVSLHLTDSVSFNSQQIEELQLCTKNMTISKMSAELEKINTYIMNVYKKVLASNASDPKARKKEESINALLHDFLNKDGGMIYLNAVMSSQDQGDLLASNTKEILLKNLTKELKREK